MLAGQLRAWPAVRDRLPTEGFDEVLAPRAGAGGRRRRSPARRRPCAGSARSPTGLRFGLHLGEFVAPGGAAATRDWLREVAAGAEAAGFDAIYVMDHFRQIPQVGRPWDDMLESWTTLAYLAACTERVRLGTLVTGITYRNVAHLGKIVATLDVLSGGRAVCGLGLAWFAEEHRAYGWDFPPTCRPLRAARGRAAAAARCCGDRAARRSTAGCSTCRRRSATRGRCRSTCRCVVGGGGERAHPAAGGPVRRRGQRHGRRSTSSAARPPCCARTASTSAGTRPTVELTHLSTVAGRRDDAQVAALVERPRPRRRSAEHATQRRSTPARSPTRSAGSASSPRRASAR